MKEKPTLTVNLEQLKQVLLDADFDNSDAIRELVIPESLTDIDKELREYIELCGCLEEFNVHPDNPSFTSENGILFSKDKVTLLIFPRGLDGNFIVPDFVRKIGRGAFFGCVWLKSVIIPDSVEEIGEGAFYECMFLSEVRLSNSIKKIPNGAFSGCMGTSITIPKSVVDIAENAFNCCNVTVDPENPMFTSENGKLKRK